MNISVQLRVFLMVRLKDVEIKDKIKGTLEVTMELHLKMHMVMRLLVRKSSQNNSIKGIFEEIL